MDTEPRDDHIDVSPRALQGIRSTPCVWGGWRGLGREEGMHGESKGPFKEVKWRLVLM